MSELVSVELLFDPVTEELVRADWQRLAGAGLSSMGANRSPSNRPHLTLLVRPQLDHLDVAKAAAALPIAVRLAEPVVFRHGERAVLARSVVAGDALRELHRDVHDSAGTGADAPHTAPGAWTPHVTLARRLRIESLPEAMALLGGEHAGHATALRRWDAATSTVTPLT